MYTQPLWVLPKQRTLSCYCYKRQLLEGFTKARGYHFKRIWVGSLFIGTLWCESGASNSIGPASNMDSFLTSSKNKNQLFLNFPGIYSLHLLRQWVLIVWESSSSFLCAAWVISKLENDGGGGDSEEGSRPLSLIIILWSQPCTDSEWIFHEDCMSPNRAKIDLWESKRNLLAFLYVKHRYS